MNKFIPTIFWVLVVIVTMSLLMEHPPALPGIPHMDKVIHAFLFMVLALTGYWAYARYGVWFFISLSAYAAITEILQGVLTVTRFASIYDWLADLFGMLIGLFVIKIFKLIIGIRTSYVR